MPPFGRPALLGALTAIVAVFIIMPVASSSYLGDDLFNSSMNGFLAENHISLNQLCWTTTMGFFRTTSRFLPASGWVGYGVFVWFGDLVSYKTYQVATLALDLVLFAWFLRTLRVGAGFGALCTLLVVATMQFHGHYDGYLGFSALTENVLALMLGSWISFALYLRGAGLAALALSAGLYLIGVLTYETCYPLSVVHVLIAIHIGGSRAWRSAWRSTWPFLALSGLALATLALGRVIHPQLEGAVYALHLDPRLYVPTVINQMSASIPLSYLVFFHAQLFPTAFLFWGTVPWWLVTALVVVAAAAAFSVLRAIETTPRALLVPAAIGAVIWVEPALLLSAIPRYQHEVGPGYGYIWMVIEGFGAALVIACGLAVLVGMLRGAGRTGAIALLAAGYAIVIASSFVTNERTLTLFEGERAARIDVTAALHDGILAGVPDGATVVTDTPAQLTHRGFAASHSNTLQNPAFWVFQETGRVEHVSSIEEEPSPLDCGKTTCAPVGIYALRDVPLDALDGYAIAGQARSTERGVDGVIHPLIGDVRVHLRGDNLARAAERGALVLTYPCGTAAAPSAGTSSIEASPDAIRRGTTVRIEQRCPIDIEQAALVKGS
jgi:hypothetical protein